jgi:N-acetylmuramic acid 6-phosphate etherase
LLNELQIRPKLPILMERLTEKTSKYRHLEQMSVTELLTNINAEDRTVAETVQAAIPQITALVEAIVPRMQAGGRLFYIGAGTSGRLGILDASECPPTFGVPHDWVIGLIAGGDNAIRKAVEFAEDSEYGAWQALSHWQIDKNDVVVGIAASGTTPYVIHGLRTAREQGIATGCVTCNPGAPLLAESDFPVVVATGPEFVTGSTRMKAGTAQKLVLNMITTSVMIRLGRVLDNKMVDMQLSNVKLIDRGVNMIVEATGLEYEYAKKLLLRFGSVREAMKHA